MLKSFDIISHDSCNDLHLTIYYSFNIICSESFDYLITMIIDNVFSYSTHSFTTFVICEVKETTLTLGKAIGFIPEGSRMDEEIMWLKPCVTPSGTKSAHPSLWLARL